MTAGRAAPGGRLRQFYFRYSIAATVNSAKTVDITIAVSAMPAAFLRDENIVVDIVDQVVPPKVTRILQIVGLTITLAFLTVTAVNMIHPAMVKFYRGQYTMVLEIDRFYHWIPILFGFFLSVAGTAWLLIHRLRGGGPPGSKTAPCHLPIVTAFASSPSTSSPRR